MTLNIRHSFWAHHYEPGFWWFRVWGWGLGAKRPGARVPMRFSERSGYGGRRFGRWFVKVLRPELR